MVIFVTGGAGFIGSNFLNLYVPQYRQHSFVNIDKLTYAANLQNLAALQGQSNYILENAAIEDYKAIDNLFLKYKPELVIHFAAESHVDRSIVGPADFIQTNIIGTFTLLETCRKHWPDPHGKLFHHVSTDEVYGALGENGLFNEKTPYDPRSPYSASKAASDHLVRAFYHTYNMPIKITNCSNNYGPYQFPEKLIPLMISNALEGKPLPVYGDGKNVRDWLYVDDHNRALWTVIEKGTVGETYNIGGNNEQTNIDLVHKLCEILAAETDRDAHYYKNLIKYVPDRPGHDFRYAIDSSKLQAELGWKPLETFQSGLSKTVKWYVKNLAWLDAIKTGSYRSWLEKNYRNR